ncbi:MAG: response regulator receiver domain [Kiritimatiellae bacterium]|nr:response regulator receiver domain [Kiritimatiellia bacterium]
MSDQQSVDLRKTIARKFCKTVLWIDDQIVSLTDVNVNDAIKCLSNAKHKKTRAGIIKKIEDGRYFQNGVESFAKAGVICQLFGFPQLDPAGQDPYSDPIPLSQCKLLAKQSDVLIVDWYLGSSSDAGNAKAMVSDLLSPESGTRFIFVLSQKPIEADKQVANEWSDKLHRADGSNWYSTGDGQFVCVLAKAEFQADPAQLVDRVFDCLANTYPDYLHWAALEISGRINQTTPRWIAELPKGTDLGMLLEKRYEDVGETVFQNLLEDLHHHLDYAKGSLLPHGLDPVRWPGHTEHQAKVAKLLADIADADVRSLLEGFISLDTTVKPHSANPRCSKKNVYNASLPDLLKRLREHKASCVQECVKQLDAFGQFCETVSRRDFDGVRRGAVYPDTKDAILVCISQACDCLRKSRLIFVRGEKQGSPRSLSDGETGVLFDGHTYLFKAGAESLRTLPITRKNDIRNLDGQSPIGCLRKDITDRLTTRFLRYAMRVGVNQPLLMRKYRDEEPY